MSRERHPRSNRGYPEPVPVIGSRLERPQGQASSLPYAALFGLLAVLLVGAVSVWQLTSGPVARQLLAEGIAALTDIDQVLATGRPAMREDAAAGPGVAISVPGYPLPVAVTAQEAQSDSAVSLRDAVLQRSAALVYEDGLRAFDQTGEASLGFFSREGLLDSFVGQLSASNHSRAGIVLIVLAAFLSLVTAMLIVRSGNHRYLRTIGLALFLAGLAGLAISALVLPFLLGRWWSGDPFSQTIDTLIDDAIGIARRNYLVITGLGLFLAIAGTVVEVVARRFAAPDPAATFETVSSSRRPR